MFKGGRPKDQIYEHVLLVEVNGDKLAQCKQCGNKQGRKPYRLREHHKKCSGKQEVQNETIMVGVARIIMSEC